MACNCKGIKKVVTMARNATGAAARAGYAVVRGKPVLVKDAVFAARMEICKACPQVKVVPAHGQDWHRCGVCHCWLDGEHLFKARMATESCPDGRWPGFTG